MAAEIPIKIATFKLCTCSFSDQVHLQVAYKSVGLEHGNAVAISYTWGEFDRRKVTLGHDDNGNEVKLNLGQEWPIQDVVQALARICREHARGRGCWIDQLCIPQDDPVERRRLVMQIPNIYRTFRTAVMLSGRPCRCFQKIAALSLTRLITGRKGLEVIIRRLEVDIEYRCWDPFGMSSHFQRLWTMQEFSYGFEVSVVWCSTVRDCVQAESEIPSLSLYSNYRLKLSTSDRLEFVKSSISLELSKRFLNGCMRSIQTRPAINQQYRDSDLLRSIVLGFFGGYLLTGTTHVPSTVGEQQNTVGQFFENLIHLGKFSAYRSATDLCDYVAAVWVDCPKYVLPVGYKSWGLPELLEDAIQQLERNFGYSLATTFPSDFSTLSGRKYFGRWRPTTYLDEVAIVDSYDIYGTVLIQQPLLIGDNGTVQPDQFSIPDLDAGLSSLGLTAEEYPHLFGPKNAYDMIHELHAAAAHWPIHIKTQIWNRCYAASISAMTNAFQVSTQSYTALMAAIMALLFDGVYNENWRQQWRVNDAFDCYAFAFALISRALSIEPDVARKRGLVLVMSKTEPKHLGLKLTRYGMITAEYMSAPAQLESRRFTIYLCDDGNTRFAKQMCDFREIRTIDSSVSGEIDIMWAQTVPKGGNLAGGMERLRVRDAAPMKATLSIDGAIV